MRVARECLANIETARRRIAAGIGHLLTDPVSREAFGYRQPRDVARRLPRQRNFERLVPLSPDSAGWRLFQLAFVLLNFEALAQPTHPDRAVVDLLFFPTGGGKTEAYLGLAAFAIARRRLDIPVSRVPVSRC